MTEMCFWNYLFKGSQQLEAKPECCSRSSLVNNCRCGGALIRASISIVKFSFDIPENISAVHSSNDSLAESMFGNIFQKTANVRDIYKLAAYHLALKNSSSVLRAATRGKTVLFQQKPHEKEGRVSQKSGNSLEFPLNK